MTLLHSASLPVSAVPRVEPLPQRPSTLFPFFLSLSVLLCLSLPLSFPPPLSRLCFPRSGPDLSCLWSGPAAVVAAAAATVVTVVPLGEGRRLPASCFPFLFRSRVRPRNRLRFCLQLRFKIAAVSCRGSQAQPEDLAAEVNLSLPPSSPFPPPYFIHPLSSLQRT